MEYTLKIAISLIPVGLFFAFYFRNFIFEQDVLHLSRAFFFGMLMSGLALLVQLALPPTNSDLLRALVHAALTEESLRFLIVAVMVQKSDETFTVTEGIFRAILVGLGFSFAENLHYALNHEGMVILLRAVSSVPMHVFCSALIGYFLAYAQHCSIPDLPGSPSRARRIRLFAAAFTLPLLYHTAFDYILFVGGAAQRWLPLLLAGGFLYVEYLQARARLVVPRNILSVLGVDADDMDIITRQRYYEEWLKDRQQKPRPGPALFAGRFVPFNLYLGIGLILLGVLGAFVLRFHPGLLLIDSSLDTEVLAALVVALPGTAGLVLLAAGRLNYLFFRENLLRLPRVAMVLLVRDSLQIHTVALDVLPGGVFLADTHEIARGQSVSLEFGAKAGRSARTAGVVRWRNREEPNLPRGCVVRYADRTPAFLLFVFSHQLKRLRMGLRLMFGRGYSRDPSPVRKTKPPAPAAPSTAQENGKGDLRLSLSPQLLSEIGDSAAFEERLRRREVSEGGAATELRHILLESDGEPTERRVTLQFRTRELIAFELGAGNCLALAVPGFGSPTDAAPNAVPLGLPDAYLVSEGEARAVEGIGCEVLCELPEMIERVVLLALATRS